MKKKVMKTILMIVVSNILLFLPISMFIENEVMFNFFAIVSFVLGSLLLIMIVKILLDEFVD